MIQFIVERTHLRAATFLIHRVWPLVVAGYLLLILFSPVHLRLYGFGPEWMSHVPLLLAAIALVCSALNPASPVLTAVAMGLATWAFLGRSATFILDVHVSPPITRAIGAAAYLVLAMATVIIYFVHVVIDIEVRMRGSSGD